MIDLPANFITDALNYTGLLFDDFKLVFFLVCGVALALAIWSKITNHDSEE